MSISIDSKERKTIIESDQSFIVSAPAGSGKTEVLVARMLKKLLIVDDAKEIIAITFTKKAANEMQQRIIQWWNDKKEPYQKDIEKIIKKFKVEDLEIFVENLNIMTIDSLALRIIKKDFTNSPLDVELQDDVDEIIEESLKDIIQEPEFEKDIQKVLLFMGGNYRNNIKNLTKMMQKRDQWLDIVQKFSHINQDEVKNSYKNYFRNEMKRRVKEVKAIFTNKEIEKFKLLYEELRTDNLKIFNPEIATSWRDLTKLIFTEKGEIRKSLKGEIEDIINEIFKDKKIHEINILKRFNNVINEEYIEDIFPLIPSFMQTLKYFYAQLRNNFIEKNTFDFNEILLQAIETLENGQVEEILMHDFSHLLVDEFQDINKSQEKFIALLLDNFASNVPHKSLLLVGDPMQSIYKFRKARVRIFIDIQKNNKFAGLQVNHVQLKTNFRSKPKIIDWMNQNLKQIFPSQPDPDLDAITYHSCKPNQDNNNNENEGVMRIHRFSANYSDGDDLYKAEAKETVRIIKDIKKKHPTREIAVLTRTRSNIQEILSELNKEKEVAIEAIGIQSIQDRQSFQDILSLSKALYNFEDKTQWVAVLRAPWCGLELKILTNLFENNHDIAAWEIINDKNIVSVLDEKSQKRLNFLTKTIKKFLPYKGHVSHSYFIESVWRALGGDKTLLENNDFADEIETFFDCINDCSTPLSVNFTDLDKKIADLHISKSNNQQKAKRSIKLMTMHAAKGLGFECVILPNLNRPQKYDEKPFFINEEEVIAIKGNEYNEQKNLYDYLWEKEKIRIENEKIRLLYVSISRAKLECHMIFTEDISKKEENIEASSFLKFLWPVVKNEESINIFHEKNTDINTFIPKLRRLKLEYIASQNDTNEALPVQEIKTDYFENIYTYTGTLIHKFYKIIIKNQLDIDIILRERSEYFKQLLSMQSYSNNESKQAYQIILNSFKSLKDCEDGKWIYQLHNEDRMEVEYHIKDSNKPRKIPDRTFIYDDARWIIDYKAVFSDKDLDLQAKEYLPQLDQYEKLFNDKYLNKKAIYFTAQGKLITL